MIVKVCGITSEKTAHIVEENGADFIGFVFAPSKRRISPENARIIANSLTKVKKVGVFVNESRENICHIAKYVGLDFVQLHGDETATFAKSIPYPIIKAFSIDQVSRHLVQQYPCEYLIIDSPGEKYRGGSGNVFNWAELEQLGMDRKKIMLAGGLSPDNIQNAINTVQPMGVDVSSGVETNGVKDPEKIKHFIQLAKVHEEGRIKNDNI